MENQNNSHLFDKVPNEHREPLILNSRESSEIFENSNNSIIDRNISRSTNKKFHYLTVSLLEMGFELAMINRIYSFYPSINSVAEMVNLMSMENEVWQHNFYKSEEDGKCLICGEDSDHLNYITEKRISLLSDIRQSVNKRVDYLLKKKNSSGKNSLMSEFFSESHRDSIICIKRESDKLYECLICLKQFNHGEMFTLGCDHIFCLECWGDFLKELIKSGKIESLGCMQHNCSQKLNEGEIYEILEFCNESELYEKYEYFKLRQEILTSNDKKFCPFPNCESYGTRKRNEAGVLPKFIVCENGHTFCFDCIKLRDDHKNISCEELIDANFEEWKKDKDLKQCPNCAYWIEKNEGCNHMTCVACRYQWCWLCNGEYSSTHYTDVESPCHGRQFNHNRNNTQVNYIPQNRCRRFFEISLIALIYFIGFIFAGFPYLIITKAKYTLRHDDELNNSKFFLTILYICFVPGTLMLQPLFLIISIFLLALVILSLPLTWSIIKRILI